ncbi:MAG: flavoprotein [Planctomycetota bacterium]|jgi:phosphopantothenoylcysteine decarboxylase/phosphopantothenate--cysteine ligase
MSRSKTQLDGVNVLLGVTGGIAAYKAVDLAAKVARAGANVKTVMTENACQLIGPKSFEAVTNSAVFTDLWGTGKKYKIDHINLADWAQIVVIVPATANIIAKIANGICDDLLSTVLCACWKKPNLIAPAMNTNMWENPALQRNINTIKDMSFQLIGPGEGFLACGKQGIGRMAEPEEILEAICQIASEIKTEK